MAKQRRSAEWARRRSGARMALGLAACFLAGPTQGAAPGAPIPLADLVTRPRPGSEPADFVAAGAQAFFLASTALTGRELWRSDGTAEGTRLVADVAPGRGSGTSYVLAALGERVLFAGSDGDTREGLWASDGTGPGTQWLADVEPWSPAVVVQGVAYFAGADAADDVELWRSDGTPEGTWRVRDIASGSAHPRWLCAVGEQLFFSADDGTAGRELWVSDGTEQGTQRLADLTPGPAGSSPSDLEALGSSLLFTSDGQDGRRQLWRLDAAETVPAPVAELFHVTGLFPAAGLVFFVAGEFGDSELWRTDGTPEGTIRLSTAWPIGLNVSGELSEIAVVGNLVFLPLVDDGGSELWRSDGTAEGTQRVADLHPGALHAAPHALTVFAGALYFLGSPAPDEVALFRSDGTEAGTVPIVSFADFPVPPTWLGVAGDALLFDGDDGASGWELWRTQGTLPSTGLLAQLDTANVGSRPGPFAWADAVAYFPVQPDDSFGHVVDPWRSDGTEEGTQPFGDPPWEWRNGFPLVLPLGRTLFYFAESGEQLWSLPTRDGTPVWLADLAGEVLVDRTHWSAALDGEHIRPSAVAWNGELWFFTAGAATNALWRSDGSASGTSIVREEWGWLGAGAHPVVAGGQLFFVAHSELWASDGTDEGTRLVKDLGDEEGYAIDTRPWSLAAAGDRVFFTALDDEHRFQLWTSDGSEAGTVPVHRAGGWQAGPPVALAGGVVFDVTDDAGAREIWWSDGSEEGTHRLGDASPDPAWRVWELVRVGSLVFFAGVDAQHGRELWKTDGTEQGTGLVRDIVPGPRGAHVRELAAWGSRLVFNACDDEGGCEPWTSDGTEQGTQRLADLVPGPLGSDPGRFASDGVRLVFAAASEAHGREPWWVPEPAAGIGSAVALGVLAGLRSRRAGRS